MSKPRVFISYSHADEKRWKNRLQKHLKVLERHGSLSFWDDRRIAAGQEWRAEIKAALDSADAAILLISPDFLGSNFINSEEVPVILQRRISDGMKVFPLIVRSCPWQKVPWLKPLQARPTDGKPLAQFRGDDVDRILSELVSEIEALLNQPQPKPSAEAETQIPAVDAPIGECPYLGLEAFTEVKKHLFFGRDEFAEALFAKVKRQNFVALVGPSGCGKSSVVQAGLLPRLRRDTQAWVINFFQPQENPFLSLAAEFIKHWQPQASSSAFINQTAKLAAELKDAQRLIEAIHRSVAAPDGRLLLVIDQFEEMFTLCDESNRRAFLDVLLAAKDAAPLTILLTLRVDFLGRAQSFSSAFSQLLNYGFIGHCPFTRAELEAAISGPACYAGLEFEPGLVNIILQEVTAHPDSLPLLEYALKEMWRNRQSQVMGYALYDVVGKVEGAISQHADAVLQALPEAEQQLALRALARLVRVAGEEGEADTRLRLPLSELPEAERAVLRTFITARLLVTKRKEGDGAEVIEVAHEALIHRWEKLRIALDSDREFLMWRQRLASRRKAWEQKGRDEKWLLYGGERDDAQRWLNERRAELVAADVEFITWDDRPDFQIERILSDGPSLLPYSYHEIRKSWFATLVFCREKEKALSIARNLEAAGSRAWALSFITPALVKIGLATEALAVAQEIEDSYCRAKALSSIARMLVRVGMAKEARETVTKALAAAREIENTKYYAPALSSIAIAQAKAGMATEALATAYEIKGWYKHADTLSVISETLVEVGMVMEALAIAREIEGSYSRASDLRSIVEAMVEHGMVMEALAVAREIEAPRSRALALHSIVEALGKVGLAKEAREAAVDAREAAIEALAIAREERSVYFRARNLSSIAKDLMKAGMITEAREAAMEARETATKALAAAREIEKAKYRASCFITFAEALVAAGMATEALDAAREIEYVSRRAMVLMKVIDYWLERRQDDDAWNLLEETQNAVSKVVVDETRSWLMRDLAVILARLRSYRAAREAAEQCSISEDRLAAYTAILREYHIERDPSLARLFTGEEEEED